MFRRLILAVTATVLCPACPALGAESAAPRVRALLLSPGGPLVNLHPVAGEQVGAAVPVGARGLSESFRPAAREFSLAVPDKTRESGYRDVTKVSLPEKGADFILLLEPAAGVLHVHVVNSRESRFGADCLLLFNASDTILGADLGGSKLLLKPRTTVFAKPPPPGEKPFYQVTFYQPDNRKARPFANTRWPHRNTSRCYVFFYRNETGRLTYHAVDEILTATTNAE